MAEYRTNSLFHYTKTKETIIKILKSGALFPNYCREVLSTDVYPNFILGIPEICFCDIPISMANLFFKKYGEYAIAFSKKWAIDLGCNPIQYFCNKKIVNAAISRDEDLREQNKKFSEIIAIQGPNLEVLAEFLKKNDDNAYTLGFLKNYYGDDFEIGYINYNENEWRYIIEDGFDDIKWHRSEEEYKKWRSQNNYNDPKTGKEVEVEEKPEPSDNMKQVGLYFEVSDINHIIVSKDDDIPFMVSEIQKLTNIGNHPLNDDQKAILISKINSLERIKTDY